MWKCLDWTVPDLPSSFCHSCRSAPTSSLCKSEPFFLQAQWRPFWSNCSILKLLLQKLPPALRCKAQSNVWEKLSTEPLSSATCQVTTTQESAHCGHTVNPPIILQQLHSIICPWIDLFSPDRCTFLSRTWKTFAEHSDRCEWTCSAVCGATRH